MIRDLKNFVPQQFLNQLQLEINQLDLKNKSGEECWDNFEKTFNSILNIHAPFRLQTRKESKLSKKPWLTNGILKSIKTKQKLYKHIIIKTNRASQEWSYYKKYRNKLTHLIETSKRNYFKSEITSCKSNQKKLWTTVNNIINLKTSKTKNRIISLNQNGQTLENSQDISNSFNKFFTTVGENLANKIKHSNYKNNTLRSTYFKKTFFLNPITKSEVKNHILNLNPSKQTKSTCPAIKFYRLSVDIISPLISVIINKCISEGVFPKSLKSAEVIPIFKKGNKSEISNYRPISLLPPLSKIFERHLHNNLTQYIKKKQLLHKHQYGFRNNSSTEMALSQLCEHITSNMEQKRITCSIFLDLCKAFDTVDHSILLYKLNNLGIRGLPAKLLQNYLQERTQVTVVNGLKSAPANISYGVPQGSILGPLLFLIYINDIVKVSTFDVRLFADDACLLLNSNNSKTLEKNVNTELIKINQWMKINRLTINYSKTNYIIFTKKSTSYNYNITIGNNVLERVKNTKYLGVILNEKLKWGPHIEYLCKKISKSSFILCKLRHYVNFNTLKMLYYSLVYPYLDYCISSWGGAPRSTLEPILILQRRIIRIITFSEFRCHTSPLFFKLNVLKLNDVYKLKLGTLFHNMINNKFTGTNNLIRLNSMHNHNTRLANTNNFYQTFSNSNLGLNTYTKMGLKFWREIPNDLKSAKLANFKLRLKQFLLINYCD